MFLYIFARNCAIGKSLYNNSKVINFFTIHVFFYIYKYARHLVSSNYQTFVVTILQHLLVVVLFLLFVLIRLTTVLSATFKYMHT